MAPRLPLVLEDARLLLLRLAHQESLSVDCGGGAARSNIQLLPYQLQVIVYDLLLRVRTACLLLALSARCEDLAYPALESRCLTTSEGNFPDQFGEN